MCAKKTPTTPTKQNALSGVSKAPVKKVTAQKPQTAKAKVDASSTSNSTAKDVKVNTDAKKSSAATKKATKTIVSETKAPSAPTTPVKGSIKLSSKDAKKINSRDSSTDNAKGKKQLVNGKAKATDSDRDKSGENKSSLIRDNKIADASDEVKSKCDSPNEQCNKFEKSSSSLSLKSNGESDNVVRDKEKLSKKGGEKAKVNLSSAASPKKINNRSSDDGSKKIADRPKSSKTVKKIGKEKESKIKISNELKNLEIEMSKSNSSLAVVIQEGLMSSGVKTSICEMVKTKSRFCSNLNSGAKKNNTEIKIHSNKESQEKVIKDDETKAKANSEAAERKTANGDQLKLIGSEDRTLAHEAKTAVSGKSKISALVNAKNKIKSFGEQKRHEPVTLPNEADPSKPVKRKYVKKKRPEDVADSSKNSSSVADARHSDKIDQNKSNCVNMLDGKNGEVKGTSKADEKRGESTAVGRKDKVESSSESTSSKSKAVSKAKSQEGSKVKKVLQSLSSGEKAVESKVESPSTAEKIKRKYVKKPKQVGLRVDKKENLQKDADGAIEAAMEEVNDSEKTSGAQKVINDLRNVSIESPKIVEDSSKISMEASKLSIEVKKLSIDSQKISSDSKKPSIESQRNGEIEKKPKTVQAPVDVKKQQEKPLKPLAPKKDSSKVETQGKVAQNKSKGKLPEKPQVKVTAKKQKVEVKQEGDPLTLNSSDSDKSSSESESDSDLSQGTFKKPSKSMAQRNLRYSKQIGHKRTRVASLKAIAKVHFLYESESRTLEANIAKAIKNSLADGSSGGEEDEDDENESKNIDLASKR